MAPPTEAARSAGGSARSSSIAWARIRHSRQGDMQASERGGSDGVALSPLLQPSAKPPDARQRGSRQTDGPFHPCCSRPDP
eukprot:COSAG04_NODE_6281_length_1366_cov_1.806630_1_plen_80_part_10